MGAILNKPWGGAYMDNIQVINNQNIWRTLPVNNSDYFSSNSYCIYRIDESKKCISLIFIGGNNTDKTIFNTGKCVFDLSSIIENIIKVEGGPQSWDYNNPDNGNQISFSIQNGNTLILAATGAKVVVKTDSSEPSDSSWNHVYVSNVMPTIITNGDTGGSLGSSLIGDGCAHIYYDKLV